jgi:hypothetical protein
MPPRFSAHIRVSLPRSNSCPREIFIDVEAFTSLATSVKGMSGLTGLRSCETEEGRAWAESGEIPGGCFAAKSVVRPVVLVWSAKLTM